MTARLVRIVTDHWADIDGYAAMNGLPDPLELPLARLCNLGWYYATKGAEGDEQALQKFKVRLWRPPPGEEVTEEDSPWSAENETAAFRSLKAALKPETPGKAAGTAPPAGAAPPDSSRRLAQAQQAGAARRRSAAARRG